MLKRLSMLWIAVRGDATRLWFALGHPESPTWLKAGAAALVLYLVSPVDIIPDVVPLLGIVDDLILVPLAMRWLLNRLPKHIQRYAEDRSNPKTVRAAPEESGNQGSRKDRFR